ncbi:hypothetical protein CYMTET_7006 [Cymbomonas tetramitiformis]|uniref:EIPR1-like beta-propeller domain-containing protein n=1 Tax=Cymbomonas tetramitiformis TaxID=36881 RepID=A0AAE0GW24_9CHLO|nr:hypothetical protein CYMTET_7006 [Cymbomonas tetramitiformis]
MISALAWLPRGAAKTTPEVTEPTAEDIEHVKDRADAEAGETSADVDSDGEAPVKPKSTRAKAKAAARAVGDLAGGMDELDMDNYDDDSDEDGAAARLFGSTAADRVFENNADDPELEGDEESDEEIEDFTIRDTDLLFLAARTEDDVSHMEVWVFEESDDPGEDGNMYVHHDLMLPAFPLCMAWMDCYPDPSMASQHGNFVAIGTFRPEIEIWNLDVLDAVAPAGMLGGLKSEQLEPEEGASAAGDSKKKKKKKKAPAKPVLKEGSHEDAVLGMCWNYNFRNVLASGSADCTVKVWDVAQQKCDRTLHHHDGKVQAVAWNPVEPQVLLSGGFDRTAQLVDMRTENGATVEVPLTADCECLVWDLKNPSCFVVSSEDGLVVCHDVRMLMDKSKKSKSTVYTLGAHDAATCAMSFNPVCHELLATASTDKTVKMWDCTGGKPSLLHTADLKIGALFAMGFCKDAPHLLAAGGSKGVVSVWDIMTKASVANRFGAELAKHARGGASKIVSEDTVIGPDEDIEEEDEDDD